MDYVAKVFDLLEIKPQERFLLFNIKRNEFEKGYYYLTNKLDLRYLSSDNHDYRSGIYNIIYILNGEVQIAKIPKISKQEQLAIDYAKACGCKWLTKNKSNIIHGFKFKPQKGKDMWVQDGIGIPIHIPISFLHWQDPEPYYIGD